LKVIIVSKEPKTEEELEQIKAEYAAQGIEVTHVKSITNAADELVKDIKLWGK